MQCDFLRFLIVTFTFMRRKNDFAELHRTELLLFDQTGDSSGFENLTRVSHDVHPSDDTFAQPQ